MCKEGFIVPKGTSYEELKERKQIIKDLYSQWSIANPEKKVWNKSLKAYINVKYLSITDFEIPTASNICADWYD